MFLHEDNEDSDQTGQVPFLVFTCIAGYFSSFFHAFHVRIQREGTGGPEPPLRNHKNIGLS